MKGIKCSGKLLKVNQFKHVDVLGTEYLILFGVPDEEIPEGSDGCMDQSIRTIKIAHFENTRDSLEDLDLYRKKVLRHEIIHAFLYESGIWNCSGSSESWANNEEMVDWIAIQFPKMLKAFEEAECI